jgi:hypothetical protein
MKHVESEHVDNGESVLLQFVCNDSDPTLFIQKSSVSPCLRGFSKHETTKCSFLKS